MENEVIEKISQTLRVAIHELSGATTLLDIVADSLDAFELLAVLSEDYEVHLEPEQLNELETIRDLAAYIEANKGTAERGESLKAI